MESKPTDQLAGMAQGVHWLLRQFDALGADMTPPPAAAARPSDAGPIEVSYLVAALDGHVTLLGWGFQIDWE